MLGRVDALDSLRYVIVHFMGLPYNIIIMGLIGLKCTTLLTPFFGNSLFAYHLVQNHLNFPLIFIFLFESIIHFQITSGFDFLSCWMNLRCYSITNSIHTLVMSHETYHTHFVS